MLLNFAVQNFMSIKDLCLMDLIPTGTYKTHQENISEIQNYKFLNTLAVFGANAAKKLLKYHNGQQHKWISTQCNPQTDVYKIVELLEEEK